jgi:hypothetical protein
MFLLPRERKKVAPRYQQIVSLINIDFSFPALNAKFTQPKFPRVT